MSGELCGLRCREIECFKRTDDGQCTVLHPEGVMFRLRRAYCPYTLHRTTEIVTKKKFVNPLKASKRGL